MKPASSYRVIKKIKAFLIIIFCIDFTELLLKTSFDRKTIIDSCS